MLVHYALSGNSSESEIGGFHGGDYEDAVFWDVTKCSSCKNRRFSGTYRLHHHGDKVGEHERFEVFTSVTMKNDVFWVVMPCGYCKNRRFGGT
jgi:hypothetical protein